ncbi:MAG: hypothetical protein J2P50_12525 [Hyphomicrobiaceae bacterium]|nr:hypothetical protein [Hyphomicrobiaceae bacterium]
MAGASDAILHLEGAQAGRLPASPVLLQVEYCDNLIFKRRAALDNFGQCLLDANPMIGQPEKITTIFGRRVSKHYRGKRDLHLPNPVIRSHYRNGLVKQYVRNRLILRTEPASNNVNEYGVN